MFPPDRYGFFKNDSPKQRRDAATVLEEICKLAAIAPPPANRSKILGWLGFAAEQLELTDLPVTDRYANHLSWLAVIEPLLPEKVDGLFMQEIRRDERIVQNLVITRVDVPEEIHETYSESFFILAGRCACNIGGQVFELTPGDYLDIPLHVPHDVRLLSPEVTAILQYRLA